MENSQQQPIAFGEAAMAMDVTIQLVIDLLVQDNREFGVNLSESIDKILVQSGPTPGLKQVLQNVRDRVDTVLARVHN